MPRTLHRAVEYVVFNIYNHSRAVLHQRYRIGYTCLSASKATLLSAAAAKTETVAIGGVKAAGVSTGGKMVGVGSGFSGAVDGMHGAAAGKFPRPTIDD